MPYTILWVKIIKPNFLVASGFNLMIIPILFCTKTKQTSGNFALSSFHDHYHLNHHWRATTSIPFLQ